jgi:methyl-accepting chemotaxis protein
MTIKQKLTLGIGSIVAVVALNTVIGSVNLSTITTLSTQTATESVPFATLAADAKYQSCQVQQFVTDGSLTKDAEVMKEAEDAHSKFMNDLNKFEEMYKSENNQQGLADIEAMRQDITTLLETGKRMAVAYTVSQEEGNKVMEELDKATGALATRVEALQKSQVDEALSNSTETMNKASSSFTIGLVFGIFTLLIGIVVGFMLTRDINNALNHVQGGLTSFFRFLNRETTKAETITLNSEDEFGQMAKVINENVKRIEAEITADNRLVEEAKSTINRVQHGWYSQHIEATTTNRSLEEFKNGVNDMIKATKAHFVAMNVILEQYAAYDYTNELKLDGIEKGGVFEILVTDINKLRDAVNEMLANGLKNGIELQHEAGNLKQAVESLSTASNQQAASLEETAAAMEEMTSNVQQNAQKANDMASMAAQTDASAKEGAELAQRTATAMTEIQVATNSINNAVAIIENIAFQTNILSLNAAVEA